MDRRLEVRVTATMGRGVFARDLIEAGTPLDRPFHTIRIPPDEVAVMAGTEISRFWFEDDRDGAAFIVLGYIELMNHDLAPNVDRTWHLTPAGEVVAIHTLRDILPGEQLLIDYRFDGVAGDPSWARGGENGDKE